MDGGRSWKQEEGGFFSEFLGNGRSSGVEEKISIYLGEVNGCKYEGVGGLELYRRDDKKGKRNRLWEETGAKGAISFFFSEHLTAKQYCAVSYNREERCSIDRRGGGGEGE